MTPKPAVSQAQRLIWLCFLTNYFFNGGSQNFLLRFILPCYHSLQPEVGDRMTAFSVQSFIFFKAVIFDFKKINMCVLT